MKHIRSVHRSNGAVSITGSVVGIVHSSLIRPENQPPVLTLFMDITVTDFSVYSYMTQYQKQSDVQQQQIESD